MSRPCHSPVLNKLKKHSCVLTLRCAIWDAARFGRKSWPQREAPGPAGLSVGVPAEILRRGGRAVWVEKRLPQLVAYGAGVRPRQAGPPPRRRRLLAPVAKADGVAQAVRQRRRQTDGL